MFSEYEIVRLRNNIPEWNLQAGAIGVVLLIYDEPNLPKAYEVEFTDKEGRTLALLTLLEQDLEHVEEGAQNGK